MVDYKAVDFVDACFQWFLLNVSLWFASSNSCINWMNKSACTVCPRVTLYVKNISLYVAQIFFCMNWVIVSLIQKQNYHKIYL